MKLKMAMLEQALGLLCNAPGEGGSEQDAETWRKRRAEWIDQWDHLIRAQQVKERNRRIAVGNEAIEDYQRREEEAAVRNPRSVETLLNGQGQPAWRVRTVLAGMGFDVSDSDGTAAGVATALRDSTPRVAPVRPDGEET